MTNFDTLALANRFKVTLDQIDLGYWQTVGGLDVSWTPCEYRSGDTGNQRMYFPGATKYQDITLTRAACADSKTVQTWLSNRSIAQSIKKTSGTIYLGDSANNTIMQWDLINVMPLKWSVDKFDASQSKVAVETLVLVHEGFLTDDVLFGGGAGGGYSSGQGMSGG